ncbi:MAG: methyltransferase domain-containing protein [Arcobacteraceae bacterium]|nr:methyltransferase domain-containing protein [Arcobacteraceae bacterium]
MSKTHQRKTWEDEFGAGYLKRNKYDPAQLDKLYEKTYGISKTNLNNDFLKDIPKDAKILEVGTNIGNQLFHLQSMGFTNLYGIEIQDRAINYAKTRTDNLNIIKGDALDIPFKDSFFDLVFTSGVLIHISPDNINSVIKEMNRVSNKYILGFEYFANKYTEVEYQGQNNLMWKTNFMQLHLDISKELSKVKEKKLSYIKNKTLINQMYLLKK